MSFRAPNPFLLEIKSLFPASAPDGILRIWLSPEKPMGYRWEPGPAYREKVMGRFPSRPLSR